MNLTHDGLTLWFGTPDTPGPFDEEVVARAGIPAVRRLLELGFLARAS